VNGCDTFRLRDDRIEGGHPWVVLSNPAENPERVVIGNFTGWAADKEQCCVCEANEDRCLTKKSIFSYADARLVSLTQLRQFVQSGDITKGQPLSPETLKKIRNGAGLSWRIPTGALAVLEEQGLIEPV
jgi:hypothetical protein